MSDSTPVALLCGGIGSGKSTAAGFLAAFGAEIVSADAAGHRALGPAGSARDAVARRWPEVVAEGEIDRGALARIVFADAKALAELEALTHPVIRADVLDSVARADAALVVVEIPLLADMIGRGWPRIVVDAPDDVRFARLLARGMDPADISARMASQPSRMEWLAAADHVIHNRGTIDALAAECRTAFDRFAAQGAAHEGR